MIVEAFDGASPLVNEFKEFPAMLYRDDPFYGGTDDPPSEAGARLFLAVGKGEIIGRAAATINRSPGEAGAATGLVGWYECRDDAAASGALLDAAAEHLRRGGCSRVVGPMNGSTWHKYRLTVASDCPPFFLDNYHRPWYGEHFRASGFRPLAWYISTRIRLSPETDKRIDRFAAVLEQRGVEVRRIVMERFDEEIERIYRVCIASFVNNYLYSPLSLPRCRELYARVRPYVDPALVLIAEDRHGEPVGFIFAVPNHFERPVTSAVIKTVAVVPRPDVRGLGTYLVACTHRHLFAAGYSAVYHALMHESNISTNILSDHGEVVRRYALLGKELR